MAVSSAPTAPRFSPVERPHAAISTDGTLAAIIESQRVVVLELPGGEPFAEVGVDPVAIANEVGWVGGPPRLLVLSRYPEHSRVHLVDPHGPRALADLRIETPMRLAATCGAHALLVSPQSAAIVTAADDILVSVPYPARAVPANAGVAGTNFLVAHADSVEEWDPQARMPKRRLKLPRAATITALGGSDRVVWMTTQQEPSRLDVLALVDRGQPRKHDLPEAITFATGHPRSDLVVCIGESGKVYVVDLDGRSKLKTVVIEGIDKAEAAGLVVGRIVGVLAAQTERPVVIHALEGEAPEPEAAAPSRTMAVSSGTSMAGSSGTSAVSSGTGSAGTAGSGTSSGTAGASRVASTTGASTTGASGGSSSGGSSSGGSSSGGSSSGGSSSGGSSSGGTSSGESTSKTTSTSVVSPMPQAPSKSKSTSTSVAQPMPTPDAPVERKKPPPPPPARSGNTVPPPIASASHASVPSASASTKASGAVPSASASTKASGAVPSASASTKASGAVASATSHSSGSPASIASPNASSSGASSSGASSSGASSSGASSSGASPSGASSSGASSSGASPSGASSSGASPSGASPSGASSSGSGAPSSGSGAPSSRVSSSDAGSSPSGVPASPSASSLARPATRAFARAPTPHPRATSEGVDVDLEGVFDELSSEAKAYNDRTPSDSGSSEQFDSPLAFEARPVADHRVPTESGSANEGVANSGKGGKNDDASNGGRSSSVEPKSAKLTDPRPIPPAADRKPSAAAAKAAEDSRTKAEDHDSSPKVASKPAPTSERLSDSKLEPMPDMPGAAATSSFDDDDEDLAPPVVGLDERRADGQRDVPDPREARDARDARDMHDARDARDRDARGADERDEVRRDVREAAPRAPASRESAPTRGDRPSQLSLRDAPPRKPPRREITIRHGAALPTPKPAWRDEVVFWTYEVFDGVVQRGAPIASPLDDLAARFDVSDTIVPALVLLYGAHLAGERGVAPVHVARVLGSWDEALGRGLLAGRGLATFSESRVRLAGPIQRFLDEVAVETGALVGIPGDIALPGPHAVVAPAATPLKMVAVRWLGQVGGAILAAYDDADLGELFVEARARGAAPMFRIGADELLELGTDPAILVVTDEEVAESLGVPRLG